MGCTQSGNHHMHHWRSPSIWTRLKNFFCNTTPEPINMTVGSMALVRSRVRSPIQSDTKALVGSHVYVPSTPTYSNSVLTTSYSGGGCNFGPSTSSSCLPCGCSQNQSNALVPYHQGGGSIPDRPNFLLGLGLGSPRASSSHGSVLRHGPNCPVDYCCNETNPSNIFQHHQLSDQQPVHTCGTGNSCSLLRFCFGDSQRQLQEQQPPYPGKIFAPHYQLHKYPYFHTHHHQTQRTHTYHNNPFLHHHAFGVGRGSQYHGQGYVVAHHHHHHHVNIQ